MSTVTFSKNTLAILKNFSSLNSNLLVKPGKTIKTITPSKNGMAVATVDETFDVEFGIWDLNKFLGVISLFNTPTFTFGEKSVKIKNGTSSVVNYYYSEPRLLSVPTKDVVMPQVNVTITLTEKQFSELQKAASVMQLPDLCFTTDNNTIVAMVSDIADPTTNSYKITVDDMWSGTDFLFHFKMENIKILPGDYTVNFAKNVVGEFVNKNISLKYWFAMEANTSKYGT
jgi:gp45 sliding clamp, C terminal